MSSGWGILIGSSEPYNEDIKEIDEQIMRLVQKRKNLAAGRNFIPATEQVQIWLINKETDKKPPSQFGAFC